MANWRDKNQSALPEVIASGVGSSKAGTGEGTIGMVVIPAGTLSVGDIVTIEAIFELHDGSGGAPAGTSTHRAKIDSSNCISIGSIARGIEFHRKYVVESATEMTGMSAAYYRPEKATAWGTWTVDITADITITFTATNLNAGDTSTLQSYSVTVVKV